MKGKSHIVANAVASNLVSKVNWFDILPISMKETKKCTLANLVLKYFPQREI